MKKNIKCHLLKSLFLTGTVLTISACNEEFKSVNKRDKELLKNTKAKINNLNEIKDFDDCLDILKTTRDFINQISDRNTQKTR